MSDQLLHSARIVSDPTILLGKPVIEGTRISVEQILDELSQGATVDDVMVEYDLSREAVLAALRHAWELAQAEANAAVRRYLQGE